MLAIAWTAACLAACQPQGHSGASTSAAPSQHATRHVSETALVRAKSYENALDGKTIEVTTAEAKLHSIAKPKPASKRYTVMIYMIGSNLESQNAAATDDLIEMTAANVDFAKTNVVVYAGGTARWNSDIPTGHNSVLDLSRPEDDRIVAQTETDPSMGAPETLSAFVNYCAKTYPADHNAIVFWDHGGGPLWGYGSDEVNLGDGLLLDELAQAMESTPYARGGKTLDWVGFDACLMGSVENVALWKDRARYLIASEEVEPGDGWDYAFLSTLNSTDKAADIGAAIVDAYGTHYKKAASDFSNPDVTLACYDLAKAGAAIDALDGLLAAMTSSIENGGYGDISRARRASKAFGLQAAGDRSEGYDLIDIRDFAARVKDDHPDQVATLDSALDSLVVASSANIDNASGLSIYIPGDNRELFEVYSQLGSLPSAARSTSGDGAGDASAPNAASTRFSDAYGTFVDAFSRQWNEVSQVNWSTDRPTATEAGVSLKLTPEQAEALSTATYTLFSRDNPDTYRIATANVAMDLDDANTLHVPADPSIIATSTDIGQGKPGLFVQVERENGKATYVNRAMTLEAAADFSHYAADANENFTVTVQADEATGAVAIESISVADDTVGIGGKGTVDATRYSHVSELMITGSPGYDADGHILPWNEWDLSSSSEHITPLEKGFGFASLPASRYGDKWSCQIVLTDVNGDSHALDPIDLAIPAGTAAQETTVTRDTDLGTLTFKVFDDHAELSKYEGDDWTVDIPADIDGVPVTAIGNSAFAYCEYLDELVIPETITSIGQSAFAHTGLYALTLPASLSHIAPAAFREMPYLKAFTLTGEGKGGALSVDDGVLFSADGKTLIAYPNAKGGTYSVPKGVTAIDYGAFALTGIADISLPDSLKTIDRAAFYGCKDLRSLDLPDGLESIGALAFGGDAPEGSTADQPRGTTVSIGPNVTYIGPSAFDGLALESIEVDARNKRFTGKGGALLNAAGDTLLELPRSGGSVFAVPEGVVKLQPHAFSDYPDTRIDFVLPASLTSCDETCFPRTYASETDEWTYACRIHAPEGSYALRFAEEHGIENDTNTDIGALAHKQATVEQDGFTLTFEVYRDHAALASMESGTDYSWTEHSLAIPAEVEGVPVTSIDSLASINGSIDVLTLPATLESIGENGFGGYPSLKRIELDGESKHFKIVDGALLTADDATLIAYPTQAEGPFAIPETVETIGRNAFNGCMLEDVTLPDDLQEIGESAFAHSENLRHVEFNQGLEVIGASAFGWCHNLQLAEPFPESVVDIGSHAFYDIGGYAGLVLPEGIERIGASAFEKPRSDGGERELAPVDADAMTIGPYLETLGGSYGATPFSGLDFARFEVDEGNEAFVADGPFLITKDAHALVAFADGHEGEAHVPDAVRKVNGSTFTSARNVTDLYLPDTVSSISWPKYRQGDELYAVLDSITVHVNKGSYGERYARDRGLPWVVD